MISEADDFKMPKWMECTWRRKACEKDECPICGRIKRDRQSHIARGEDPDSMEAALEDVSRSFAETAELLQKEVERMGIDLNNLEDATEPPEAETFPLYRQVKHWRDAIFKMLEGLNDQIAETEAAKDLAWYTNLTPVKAYRQLCNRWEIENEEDAELAAPDYNYTRSVLRDCFRIIKYSLATLSQQALQDGITLFIPIFPADLEKQVLEI